VLFYGYVSYPFIANDFELYVKKYIHTMQMYF